MLVVDRKEYSDFDSLVTLFGGNPEVKPFFPDDRDLFTASGGSSVGGSSVALKDRTVASPDDDRPAAHELAEAILFPHLVGLSVPHERKNDAGDLDLSPMHSVTCLDVNRTIGVRRALLLGANDRESELRLSAFPNSTPASDPKFYRSTPLDHLSVLLAGEKSYDLRGLCPEWMQSEPPIGMTSYIASRHYQRRAVGLDYIVRQIAPSQSNFSSQVYNYLDNLADVAAHNDFLLVVIEGQLPESRTWDSDKVRLNRKDLLRSLADVPGWKFIVDMSSDGHESLEAKADLISKSAGHNETGPDAQIGMLVSHRSRISYQSMHADLGDPTYHNQGVWDRLMDYMMLLTPISDYQLTGRISENAGYPFIPAISTYFSLVI